MWGLIIKDLMFFRTSWKNLLITFIGTMMISISIGNYTLAICVVPIYLLSSGINTFQTDEFYNTMAYTLSYPLTRKQIVLAKYLFTLIMGVIALFVGLVIYSLIHFIIGPGYYALNINMIFTLLTFEAAGIIVDAIFYPIIYKFGCEKSRLVMMSAVMLLLGTASLLSVSANVFKIIKIDWNAIIKFLQAHGTPILAGTAIVLFIISYFLSYALYRKRDF